jgi:branched-chain amino acid transport system ATP-binding protein/nonpolar-amino-acid-transporting ATPase
VAPRRRDEGSLAMMADTDILRLDAIGHNFGGLSVLRSVSFAVPERGLTGLIGPNGSGKTTLFNVISGYLAQQHGSVIYRGHALAAASVQDRSRAGMVRTFQTPKIFEHMTVLENIMAGCCKLMRTGLVQDMVRTRRARRVMQTIAERARDACQKFELDRIRDLPALNLTAGQRRILEIARAVVGEPQLLMLDEPSSGLNAEEIENLRGWIRQLRQEGMSILLVSHDMELMTVVDTVHVLYFGEIIASGSMDAIKQNARVREVYLGV